MIFYWMNISIVKNNNEPFFFSFDKYNNMRLWDFEFMTIVTMERLKRIIQYDLRRDFWHDRYEIIFSVLKSPWKQARDVIVSKWETHTITWNSVTKCGFSRKKDTIDCSLCWFPFWISCYTEPNHQRCFLNLRYT